MDTKDLTIDSKKIWQEALEILKKKVASSTFQPWITPLEPVNPDEEQYKKGKFTLKSNQAFGVAHLNQKFLPQIQEALDEIVPERIPVEIIFVPTDVKKAPKKKKNPDEKISLMQERLDNLKQMHSFCALNLKYTFENFVKGENSKVAYDAAKLVSESPTKNLILSL